MVALVAVRSVVNGAECANGRSPFQSVTSFVRSGTVRFFFRSFLDESVYSPTRSRKKNAMMTKSATAQWYAEKT